MNLVYKQNTQLFNCALWHDFPPTKYHHNHLDVSITLKKLPVVTSSQSSKFKHRYHRCVFGILELFVLFYHTAVEWNAVTQVRGGYCPPKLSAAVIIHGRPVQDRTHHEEEGRLRRQPLTHIRPHPFRRMYIPLTIAGVRGIFFGGYPYSCR